RKGSVTIGGACIGRGGGNRGRIHNGQRQCCAGRPRWLHKPAVAHRGLAIPEREADAIDTALISPKVGYNARWDAGHDKAAFSTFYTVVLPGQRTHIKVARRDAARTRICGVRHSCYTTQYEKVLAVRTFQIHSCSVYVVEGLRQPHSHTAKLILDLLQGLVPILQQAA